MARSGQPGLTLRDSRVTFTGYLSRVRASVADDVRRHGGSVNTEVSRATDIVVQGAPNASYKYKNIGVKLDNVRRLRGEGYRVAILIEEELDMLLAGGRLSPAQERIAFGESTEPKTSPDPVGVAYRFRPVKRRTPHKREAWWSDPNELDRRTRGHMTLQNSVARAAEQRGFQPLSPVGADCQFDIAWRKGRGLTVVEIKTLSATNEAMQLRLGLGQVLDYRNLLLARRGAENVRGVICVPCAPRDRRFLDLCRSVGVDLTWPPNYRGIW